MSQKQNEGNAKVVFKRPPALKPEQIAALAAIVGKENVALDDYSRVKYASAKTTEEMLELRQGNHSGSGRRGRASARQK